MCLPSAQEVPGPLLAHPMYTPANALCSASKLSMRTAAGAVEPDSVAAVGAGLRAFGDAVARRVRTALHTSRYWKPESSRRLL